MGSRMLKLGKMVAYDKCKCIFCNKSIYYSGSVDFKNQWLCVDCSDQLKFSIGQVIYFLKENRDLKKLEIIKGKIIKLYNYRELTYIIHYYNDQNILQRAEVYQDYIFSTKEEALKNGNEYGILADEIEIADYYLMKKQDRLVKAIKKFLESDSAINFGVTGIDVNLEHGYINFMWKFGNRFKGDVRDDT